MAELAISLVLLLSAGLALKSMWKLVHVDPGFQATRTVTAAIGFAQTNTRSSRSAESPFSSGYSSGLRPCRGSSPGERFQNFR